MEEEGSMPISPNPPNRDDITRRLIATAVAMSRDLALFFLRPCLHNTCMHLIIGNVNYYYYRVLLRRFAYHVPIINARGEVIAIVFLSFFFLFFAETNLSALGDPEERNSSLIDDKRNRRVLDKKRYFPPILTFRGNRVQHIG